MANYMDQFKNRIRLAENFYSKNHNGQQMDAARKITLGKCLDNVNSYLTESFDPASGTQRSNMGDYKKFCIALTNLTIPSLIAPELVHTAPMSSFVGNIAFARFVKGANKGESKVGDLINDPWALGKVDTNYTGSAVVETAAGTEGANYYVSWLPVIDNKVTITLSDGTKVEKTVDDTGKILEYTATTGDKIAYVYDNQIIPQNALPTIKVEMDNIVLQAKARRIAVRYSQMAAFQAKQDYGMDMETELARQAVSELSYEIDTDIVNMLADAANLDTDLNWSRTLPIGVSKQDHYAGFAEILEKGKVAIYNQTLKHMPNALIVAPDLLPVLSLVPGYTSSAMANGNNFSGPFQCGVYNGMKVFCSPAIAAGNFVFDVAKGALEASAGCFAPYMPIVPTSVLQGPDGGTAQGWSTLYDAKVLNENLLVKGHIV